MDDTEYSVTYKKSELIWDLELTKSPKRASYGMHIVSILQELTVL